MNPVYSTQSSAPDKHLREHLSCLPGYEEAIAGETMKRSRACRVLLGVRSCPRGTEKARRGDPHDTRAFWQPGKPLDVNTVRRHAVGKPL